MDWSKFDANADELAAIKQDIENAANGTGVGKEVPAGDYECKITKCELKLSKSGRPMVSIWMKIVAGEYEKQMIFYNQIVEKGFQIHLIKEFFKPFELAHPLTFDNYAQFEQALAIVQDEVKDIEFALTYSVNDKGYSSYLVTQLFAF